MTTIGSLIVGLIMSLSHKLQLTSKINFSVLIVSVVLKPFVLFYVSVFNRDLTLCIDFSIGLVIISDHELLSVH